MIRQSSQMHTLAPPLNAAVREPEPLGSHLRRRRDAVMFSLLPGELVA
jgi:hypothetical protein